MKFNFNLQFAAESGKITKDDMTAEIGQISCPVTVEVELEASEVQQMLGVCKEFLKDIPVLIEKYQNGERETAAHRAKLDEHLEDVRRKMEADNIRLRAELADNSATQAHLRSMELAEFTAKLRNDQATEQPDEPLPAERRSRDRK